MKLWLVVTIFGNIAMTVGPLPSDVTLSECWVRAIDQQRDYEQRFDDPAVADSPDMIVDGRRVTRQDIRAECRISDARPRLEE